jgi:hypothetical protein
MQEVQVTKEVDSGGPQPTTQHLATDASAGSMAPQFPPSAYLGIAAEFAELYAQYYETPKEFFYIDLLAITGAALSGRLQLDCGPLCTQPRLYVLKVAPSAWTRKSTSMKLALAFTAAALDQQSNPSTGLALMPAVVTGVGSAEGLQKALGDHPRMVFCVDEFRTFERKAKIESSVLLPVVNQLFDSNEAENYTKNDHISVKDVHLSLVANTTDDCFEQMVGGHEMKDIGFLNRLLAVTGRSSHEIDVNENPPEDRVRALQDKLKSYFQMLAEREDAQGGKVLLQFTSEARAIWRGWYHHIERNDITARLDSIGLRLMAILTFLSGKWEVDSQVVRAVIDLLEYERVVRETFAPPEGETAEARMEESILRVLKNRGDTTERILQQFTNARRFGAKVFTNALKNLLHTGQIVVRSAGKTWSYRLAEAPESSGVKL